MKCVKYSDVRNMIIESNLRGRDYREMMDGLDELQTIEVGNCNDCKHWTPWHRSQFSYWEEQNDETD